MDKSTFELAADHAAVLDLGVALGHNQAFALVAGRCSAAQASMLVRLRQEKKYLLCANNWREFCTDYVGISGSEADRMIRLWDEFGPEYFELAQLMRISPEGYRAIEPAVKDGALRHHGETIAFDPENSRKLLAAVADLRSSHKPAKKQPRERPMHERIAHLDRRCDWVIAQFEEIARKESCGENWLLFAKTLTRVREELSRIERENDL